MVAVLRRGRRQRLAPKKWRGKVMTPWCQGEGSAAVWFGWGREGSVTARRGWLRAVWCGKGDGHNTEGRRR